MNKATKKRYTTKWIKLEYFNSISSNRINNFSQRVTKQQDFNELNYMSYSVPKSYYHHECLRYCVEEALEFFSDLIDE